MSQSDINSNLIADLGEFYGVDLDDSDYEYDQSDDTSFGPLPDTPLNLDSPEYDINQYIDESLTLPMERLLDRVTHLGEEKQVLDLQMQELVYDNYNNFLSATHTIRHLNSQMGELQKDMEKIRKSLNNAHKLSSTITKKLEKPQQRVTHLDSLSKLLRSLQFIFKLPSLMNRCLKTGQYAFAVHSYFNASPFLHRYRQLPSFLAILNKTDETVAKISEILQKSAKSDIWVTPFDPAKEAPLGFLPPTITETSDGGISSTRAPHVIPHTILPSIQLPSTNYNNSSDKATSPVEQVYTYGTLFTVFSTLSSDQLRTRLENILLQLLLRLPAQDLFLHLQNRVESIILGYISRVAHPLCTSEAVNPTTSAQAPSGAKSTSGADTESQPAHIRTLTVSPSDPLKCVLVGDKWVTLNSIKKTTSSELASPLEAKTGTTRSGGAPSQAYEPIDPYSHVSNLAYDDNLDELFADEDVYRQIMATAETTKLPSLLALNPVKPISDVDDVMVYHSLMAIGKEYQGYREIAGTSHLYTFISLYTWMTYTKQYLLLPLCKAYRTLQQSARRGEDNNILHTLGQNIMFITSQLSLMANRVITFYTDRVTIFAQRLFNPHSSTLRFDDTTQLLTLSGVVPSPSQQQQQKLGLVQAQPEPPEGPLAITPMTVKDFSSLFLSLSSATATGTLPIGRRAQPSAGIQPQITDNAAYNLPLNILYHFYRAFYTKYLLYLQQQVSTSSFLAFIPSPLTQHPHQAANTNPSANGSSSTTQQQGPQTFTTTTSSSESQLSGDSLSPLTLFGLEHWTRYDANYFPHQFLREMSIPQPGSNDTCSMAIHFKDDQEETTQSNAKSHTQFSEPSPMLLPRLPQSAVDLIINTLDTECSPASPLDIATHLTCYTNSMFLSLVHGIQTSTALISSMLHPIMSVIQAQGSISRPISASTGASKSSISDKGTATSSTQGSTVVQKANPQTPDSVQSILTLAAPMITSLIATSTSNCINSALFMYKLTSQMQLNVISLATNSITQTTHPYAPTTILPTPTSEGNAIYQSIIPKKQHDLFTLCAIATPTPSDDGDKNSQDSDSSNSTTSDDVRQGDDDNDDDSDADDDRSLTATGSALSMQQKQQQSSEENNTFTYKYDYYVMHSWTYFILMGGEIDKVVESDLAMQSSTEDTFAGENETSNTGNNGPITHAQKRRMILTHPKLVRLVQMCEEDIRVSLAPTRLAAMFYIGIQSILQSLAPLIDLHCSLIKPTADALLQSPVPIHLYRDHLAKLSPLASNQESSSRGGIAGTVGASTATSSPLQRMSSVRQQQQRAGSASSPFLPGRSGQRDTLRVHYENTLPGQIKYILGLELTRFIFDLSQAETLLFMPSLHQSLQVLYPHQQLKSNPTLLSSCLQFYLTLQSPSPKHVVESMEFIASCWDRPHGIDAVEFDTYPVLLHQAADSNTGSLKPTALGTATSTTASSMATTTQTSTSLLSSSSSSSALLSKTQTTLRDNARRNAIYRTIFALPGSYLLSPYYVSVLTQAIQTFSRGFYEKKPGVDVDINTTAFYRDTSLCTADVLAMDPSTISTSTTTASSREGKGEYSGLSSHAANGPAAGGRFRTNSISTLSTSSSYTPSVSSFATTATNASSRSQQQHTTPPSSSFVKSLALYQSQFSSLSQLHASITNIIDGNWLNQSRTVCPPQSLSVLHILHPSRQYEKSDEMPSTHIFYRLLATSPCLFERSIVEGIEMRFSTQKASSDGSADKMKSILGGSSLASHIQYLSLQPVVDRLSTSLSHTCRHLLNTIATSVGKIIHEIIHTYQCYGVDALHVKQLGINALFQETSIILHRERPFIPFKTMPTTISPVMQLIIVYLKSFATFIATNTTSSSQTTREVEIATSSSSNLQVMTLDHLDRMRSLPILTYPNCNYRLEQPLSVKRQQQSQQQSSLGSQANDNHDTAHRPGNTGHGASPSIQQQRATKPSAMSSAALAHAKIAQAHVAFSKLIDQPKVNYDILLKDLNPTSLFTSIVLHIITSYRLHVQSHSLDGFDVYQLQVDIAALQLYCQHNWKIPVTATQRAVDLLLTAATSRFHSRLHNHIIDTHEEYKNQIADAQRKQHQKSNRSPQQASHGETDIVLSDAYYKYALHLPPSVLSPCDPTVSKVDSKMIANDRKVLLMSSSTVDNILKSCYFPSYVDELPFYNHNNHSAANSDDVFTIHTE